MSLSNLDLVIIASYLIITLAIGIYFSRRASSGLAEFFVSGRNLPWWIAGTSMVATTFAADTPLAVTSLTAKHGLAGNWLWWAMAMGGMVTVFVFSKLWRRAEVLTDVELIELRYTGEPAKYLRIFRTVYTSLLVNCIIIGWVTGAMLTVLNNTIFYNVSGADPVISDWLLVIILLGVVGVYSTLSGMWGVAITDFIQFFLAMGGCIFLAVVCVNHLGGTEALREQVIETSKVGEQAFNYFPNFTIDDPWLPVQAFFLMIFVQWWSTWYPGAEPGGGGYVVQRMASCKDERHSLLATLWFQIAHYCLRPWPWLIISFAALALYPDLAEMENPGVGFPMIIRDLAPDGLKGLMLVVFFAAFMSTISTQINWGASYLINDLYKPYIKPEASDKQLATASRFASVIVLVTGGVVAYFMTNISVDDAWAILLALGAGTGGVFMLRWFWWRINAWSEIAAMVASLVFYLIVSNTMSFEHDAYGITIVAILCTVVWLAITLLTQPEPQGVLERFYRKVHPGGPGWKRVQAAVPDVTPDSDLLLSVFTALIASLLVYTVLPMVGAIIFKDWTEAIILFAASCVIGVIVGFCVKRLAANIEQQKQSNSTSE